MRDVSELMYGPFYYSFIWLIVGISLLADGDSDSSIDILFNT